MRTVGRIQGRRGELARAVLSAPRARRLLRTNDCPGSDHHAHTPIKIHITPLKLNA